MTDTPSIQPCQKVGSKTYAFLVHRDKQEAIVLDNFVWVVATKHIPAKEFGKEWKTVTLPEDKIEKMLQGLAAYAIYAGMTPEAAEYLPKLTPMSDGAVKVATYKGEALLERYKTQAAIEEAAEKAGRPLAGAALMAVARKELEKANQMTETPADEPKPKGLAGRRRSTQRGEEARKLAAAVSEDLAAAEAEGKNPVEELRTTGAKGRVAKQVAKAEKAAAARAKPFDESKLKGPDDKWKSVSAAFKGILLEESRKPEAKRRSDEAIFREVQKQFDLDDSKRGYVQWNRNWLKKEGLL